MDITLNLYSKIDHCAQICAGFMLLAQNENNNINLSINDQRDNNSLLHKGMYVVEAIIDGKRIIYDVMDGYNDIDGTKYYLKNADYYFKRSFSNELNHKYFTDEECKKIYPLGMNYSVLSKKNPYNNRGSIIKNMLHVLYRAINLNMPNSYFTYDKFEETPINKNSDFKILFCTRLWEINGCENNEWLNNLNSNRIATIRALKEHYKDNFFGGLENSKLSQKMAPDLTLSKAQTNRYQYLKNLHKADICIGTIGLHNSTGWKTGEYVACAKAIIHEPFIYDVPGDFKEGKNYLEFTNTNELINKIDYLLSNPEKIYEMKLANKKYYENYLRPDKLIQNTLNIIK